MNTFLDLLRGYVEKINQYSEKIDLYTYEMCLNSDELSEEECIEIESAREEKIKWQIRLADAVGACINDDFYIMTVEDWIRSDKLGN